MTRLLPLWTLLWAGCGSDTVAVKLQLDTRQCAAQTQITRVQLFVLNKVGTSLCIETQGFHGGASGQATLPPVKPPGDVVVLALVYGDDALLDGGPPPPPMDGPPPPMDGSPPAPDGGLPPCGDGFCDTAGGETCASCPIDCCRKMDFGPIMDHGFYPDTGAPPLLDGGTFFDGSKGFGLTGCVRCYALQNLVLGKEPITRQLTLTPVSGCKVPDSAFDGLGVLALPLPPPEC